MINRLLYSAVIMSLLALDYVLGNGFVIGFRRVFCKMACVVKKAINWNVPTQDAGVQHEQPSLSVFVTELFILSITMMVLNRYKRYQSHDRIDDLLKESKQALRQTNEFLEKWRLRRVYLVIVFCSIVSVLFSLLTLKGNRRDVIYIPNEYSYLDEEPQQIKPLKLEVPILHMAILDTRVPNRLREGGDAGDSIKYTDSALLSVTTLLEDDLDDSIPEETTKVPGEQVLVEDVDNYPYNNRFLWDVIEEDMTNVREDF